MYKSESVELKDLAEIISRNTYKVLRINHIFNIEKVRKTVFDALINFPPQKKDGCEKYWALGLQFGDENNPYYDTVARVSSFENGTRKTFQDIKTPAYKKNLIGQELNQIFDFFMSEIILTRGRVLIADPGFVMNEHIDGFFCATLHLALQSDSASIINVDGEDFHIPVDGHFYIMNASLKHKVVCRSAQRRIHIAFPLQPINFRKLTRSQFTRTQPFFEQYKIEIQKHSHIEIIDDE